MNKSHNMTTPKTTSKIPEVLLRDAPTMLTPYLVFLVSEVVEIKREYSTEKHFVG